MAAPFAGLHRELSGRAAVCAGRTTESDSMASGVDASRPAVPDRARPEPRVGVGRGADHNDDRLLFNEEFAESVPLLQPDTVPAHETGQQAVS